MEGPVKQLLLGKEREERLTADLDDHLQDIQDRRTSRERVWQGYRDLYEARAKAKDFPWPNASNVPIPLVAITTDAIHANMMNRIFGHDRVWDTHAVRPSERLGVNPADDQPITWADASRAVQDFMALATRPAGMVNIYNPAEDAILECIKLGTSVLYNPWVTNTIPNAFVEDETLGVVTRGDITTFEGCRPQLIGLEDFELVPGYSEIHGENAAFLFGHRYLVRHGQLVTRWKQGKFRRGNDRLKSVFRLPGEEEPYTLKDARTVLEGDPESYTDTHAGDYLLRELWLRWQWDEDGPEIPIYVVYHKKSRSILSCRTWPYRTPPYHPMRYIRREGSFYGMGVPEILESLQRGISTSFNQTVDNVTIANMRCIKVKANTLASQQSMHVYPGRRFLVNSLDEIDSFQLGEIYPSAFQVGLLFRDFAERRSGIADYNLGRESDVLGRSSTATTTLALIQENSRRFDLYSKDIRRALGELGMQSLELIARHQPIETIFGSLGPERGALVAGALGDGSTLPHDLRIETTTAAAASNKELARQNAVTAFSIVSQYLEKLFQLSTVMANPQVPEPIRKLAYDMSQTAERLMQRVLEGFDLPELATFLPQLEGLMRHGQQPPPAPMGGQGPMGPPGQLPAAAPNGPAAVPPNGGGGGGLPPGGA